MPYRAVHAGDSSTDWKVQMKRILARVIGGAIGLAAVLVLTSCTSSSEVPAAERPGAAPSTAPEEASDMVTDVKPLLISNGFKEERILPIMTNSAYWVAPFATAAELEQDGDDSTPGCIFKLTRNDYESGPLDKHPFTTHDNVAKIKVRTLDPQGAMGSDLPQVVEMPIEDLTPQSLKEAFEDSLSQCGDTNLR